MKRISRDELLAKHAPESVRPKVNVDDFAPMRERKKPKGITKAILDKAIARARDRASSGEWDGAKPIDFVALYIVLHEMVYKVTPTDGTRGEAGLIACALVKRMLDRDFDSDTSAMAEYARWVWQREREREARRGNDDVGGYRIGLRYMFSGALVTDYKVAIARREAKR
ncbi:MAG: hypothetical protein PVSMB8_02950 [Vulcanimicrobiaceae bacterium]